MPGGDKEPKEVKTLVKQWVLKGMKMSCGDFKRALFSKLIEMTGFVVVGCR